MIGRTASTRRCSARARQWASRSMSKRDERARSMTMRERFRVGMTRDILDSRGEPAFGRARAGAARCRAATSSGSTCPTALDRRSRPTDGALRRALREHRRACRRRASRAPTAALRVVAATASATTRSTCAAHDARRASLVTNTPMPMPRPVATIALTFIFALAGKLIVKDRLTRTGRWHERMDNMGMGLTGAHAGRDRRRRASARSSCAWRAPFDLKLLAADPYVECGGAAATSARARSTLDTLLRESDFVVAMLLLNDDDAPPDGCARVRADEADRVLHQRVARAGRRRARR